MVVGLLVAGLLVGLLGFASARRVDPHRWASAVMQTLFWTGAPMTAIVAMDTRLDMQLITGLAAGWVALLFSFAVVLLATRRRPAPDRAQTMLAVCWPNTGWIGLPAAVVVFGWDALPLAIAFSQICGAPFTQILLPSASAAIMSGRADVRGRLRAVASNPYLPALLLGYGLAAAGVHAPALLAEPARWAILGTTIPAFAAVGALVGESDVRIDAAAVRLVAARLSAVSVPMIVLAAFVPVPGVFILAAAMSTGMATMGVAAAYRVPTDRLAPALALSTVVVLGALAVVPLARLA